ncbi:MAG: hypothetical protein GXO81_03330 [Chlorobi bacterium]|nr:hypothetical protein [Chlorobiota bacterium]
MKAIEINSKTDKNGHLRIDYQLDKSERNVRILILLEDDLSELDEEKLWMDSISKNPAFDYLNDPAENIYSLEDGEPYND